MRELGALAYFAFARALGTRNLYSAGSQDNNSKMVAARLVDEKLPGSGIKVITIRRLPVTGK
jgi:hypothetical protein